MQGQNRPVTVKRLVIRDSVEQRILALQEKKQMLMDGAMGEGEGGRLPRLSARELVDLFGREDGHD
jgi:SNF2 family DNA or RNA helicase